MISLYDGQITDLLTNGARYNPEIRAMSWALLQEKQRIMEQALQTRTLAMIDSLPERILDILAVELRTPFYQQDFSIASKRELIKETLIYYTYMGTPEAVNRMLSAVFPGSYIEEWYTYGGQPYHFQVILEMSNYREAANAATIIKAVKKVKRLTAHLDGLVYQCNIGIVIGTHGQGYKYRSPWPGRTWAGTQPWRNKRGGLEHEELEVGTDAKGWAFTSEFSGQNEAGTVPYRNKRGGHSPEALEIGADAQGFSYTDDPAGTKPKRSTLLRDTDGGMDILSERTAYGYKANATGKSESGTEPWRSAKGGHDEESVRLEAETQSFRYESTATGTEPKRSKSIKTEVAEVNVLSEGQAHGYKTNLAGKMESGTEPQRAQTFRQDDGEFQVTSSSQGFTYTVQASGDEESGTEPQRRTKGGDLDGAFFTTADGQGYPYRIIMCGTAYCNNKRRRSLC